MSERINRERRRLVSRFALALTVARLGPVGATLEQLACAARPLAGGGDLQKHRRLVQAEPNKQLPEVRSNRAQLQQVLLNLIMNAIDAMAVKDEPRILSIRSEAHEGDRVLVAVADNGTGLTSQDANRIFNPRFTTKSDGMGLGLAICRAIIEAHEGRLWFAPNTPRGTVFQFTLLASSRRQR